MHVALAADHAGCTLKQELARHAAALGHEVLDLGTNDPTRPVDYPDYAAPACQAVREGRCPRAVLVCGSGVGVSVTANKFPGIRAALCHDTYSAHQGVEHDDMNVLCIGARVIGPELAREVLTAFLAARYTAEERHARRLAKMLAIEREHMRAEPRSMPAVEP